MIGMEGAGIWSASSLCIISREKIGKTPSSISNCKKKKRIEKNKKNDLGNHLVNKGRELLQAERIFLPLQPEIHLY